MMQSLSYEQKINAVRMNESENNFEKNKKEKVMLNNQDDFTAKLKDLILPNEAEEITLENLIMNVQFMKPKNRQFIRTKPGDLASNIHSYGFMEDNDFGKTTFIVSQNIFEQFKRHCFRAKLVTCIDRQGGVFLWPLRINKKENSWNSSAREAAFLAETKWLSKLPHYNGATAYEFQQATGNLGEPNWPSNDFDDLMRIALKNYYINDQNHPVIQKLQGYI